MQKRAKDSSVNRVGNQNGNSCLDSTDLTVGLFAKDRDSIFHRLRCRKMATGHGGTLKGFARSMKPGVFALVSSIHHITLRLRMFHGSLSIPTFGAAKCSRDRIDRHHLHAQLRDINRLWITVDA